MHHGLAAFHALGEGPAWNAGLAAAGWERRAQEEEARGCRRWDAVKVGNSGRGPW